MIPTRRKRQKVATEYGFSDRFMQEVSAGMRKYPERYPNATIQDGEYAWTGSGPVYENNNVVTRERKGGA